MSSWEAPGSPQANPPWRHHYIPEFYQRNWAGRDERVERYVRHGSAIHCKRVSPRAAGFEPHLYRHPRADMDEWTAQQLEWAIFSRIDNAAAKALDALVSDRAAIWDNGIRADWSVFLRSMLEHFHDDR